MISEMRLCDIFLYVAYSDFRVIELICVKMKFFINSQKKYITKSCNISREIYYVKKVYHFVS